MFRQDGHSSAVSPIIGRPDELRQDPSGVLAGPRRHADHAVHAVIGATADEANEEGFFGASSAGSFMQLVKRMVEQKLMGGQSVSPDSARVQTNVPRLVPNGVPRQHLNDYVLPTRTEANSLKAVYWQYVHTLYPYLDKVQMQQDYEELGQERLQTLMIDPSCACSIQFSLSQVSLILRLILGSAHGHLPSSTKGLEI